MRATEIIEFDWTNPVTGKTFALRLVPEFMFLYDSDEPEYQEFATRKPCQVVYLLQAAMADGSFEMSMGEPWYVREDEREEFIEIARNMVDQTNFVRAWIAKVATVVPGSSDHRQNLINYNFDTEKGEYVLDEEFDAFLRGTRTLVTTV